MVRNVENDSEYVCLRFSWYSPIMRSRKVMVRKPNMEARAIEERKVPKKMIRDRMNQTNI
jgi:hypothetical protein